ncbi:hypothetical protein Pelo_579 [Pelomyxa schiedti]|nr:hypothetical protein Pelo_579 [Pelomyxa schiedti]
MKVLSWHTPCPISEPQLSDVNNAPGTTAAAAAPAVSSAATTTRLEKEMQCAVHGKEMDLFCVKDDVVVCAHCLLKGPHIDPSTGVPHTSEPLETAVVRMRKQLGDGKAFLSELSDTLCARKTQLDAEQCRIAERCEAAKAEAHRQIATLRTALGERESQLISQIETLSSERVANIRRLSDQRDELSTQIAQSQSALKNVELLPSFPFLLSCKQSLETHVAPLRTIQLSAPGLDGEVEFYPPNPQFATQQIMSFGFISPGVCFKQSSFSASPQQCDVHITETTVIKVTSSLCDQNGQPVNETVASKIPLQLHACFVDSPSEDPRVKVNGLSVEVGPFTKPGHHKLSLQLHPFVTPVVVTLDVRTLAIGIGRSTATYPGYRMMILSDFTEEPMKTRVFDIASAHGGAFQSLASFTPNNICLIQEGFVEFGGSDNYLQATSTYGTGDTAPVGQWNVCYLYKNTGRNFSQLRNEAVTARGPARADAVPALFVSDTHSS